MSLSLLIGQSSAAVALIVGAAGAFIGYHIGCQSRSRSTSAPPTVDTNIAHFENDSGEYKMVILVRNDLNMVAISPCFLSVFYLFTYLGKRKGCCSMLSCRLGCIQGGHSQVSQGSPHLGATWPTKGHLEG